MYKLYNDIITKNVACIIRLSDNASIPLSLDNTDYQAYLKWLEDGGIPEPADE
jgi:hypothetical protein